MIYDSRNVYPMLDLPSQFSYICPIFFLHFPMKSTAGLLDGQVGPWFDLLRHLPDLVVCLLIAHHYSFLQVFLYFSCCISGRKSVVGILLVQPLSEIDSVSGALVFVLLDQVSHSVRMFLPRCTRTILAVRNQFELMKNCFDTFNEWDWNVIPIFWVEIQYTHRWCFFISCQPASIWQATSCSRGAFVSTLACVRARLANAFCGGCDLFYCINSCTTGIRFLLFHF